MIGTSALATAGTTAESRFARAAGMLVLAYPLLWALGAAFLFWPLMAILSVPYLAQAGVTRLAGASIAVGALLAASSVVGVLSFGWQVDRLVGLAANVTVWVGLAGLLTVAERSDLTAVLERGFALTVCAQGAVILLAWWYLPSYLPIPLTSHWAGSFPDSLRAFSTNAIVYQDWLGTAQLRSLGMMGNPTWAGAFAVIAVLAMLPLFAEGGRWRMVAVLAVAAGGVGMALSLSRSAFLGLAIAGGVALLQVVRRHSMVGYHTLGFVAPLLVAAFTIVNWSRIVSFVLEANGTRAGSLDSRSAIYRETWRLIRNLPVPVLGYGIKPHDPTLVASVATHSTYLGMLFRAGILGLAAVVVLIGGVVVMAHRAGSAIGVAIAVFIAIWCVLEDVDPGHLLPLGLVYAVTVSCHPRGGPVAPAPTAVAAAPVRRRRVGATREG